MGVPISDTLDQPAEQDTFTAGFKLEEANYESLAADETLAAALEENICAQFSASTNTPRAWCSCEFSAGSVNVKVSIVAPADESLPEASDMSTPAPATILEAVTSTEGIEALQQGGKPFGMSEVKAVFFKKDAVEATDID